MEGSQMFAHLTERETAALRDRLTAAHGDVHAAGYHGDITAREAAGLADDLNAALMVLAALDRARAAARGMVGRSVKLRLRGDPFFGGVTLRWGVLREVTASHLVIDGYHDSAGIGAYMPGRGGCNVTEGVPVSLAEVVGLEADYWAERKRTA